MRSKVALLLCSTVPLFAEINTNLVDYVPPNLNEYPADLLIDRYLSPFAGATDLLTLQDACVYLVGKVWKEQYNTNSPLSIINRGIKQLIFNVPLSLFLSTTQHEVFGHGYRVRSLGSDVAKVQGYTLGLPFPYGQNTGSTTYSITPQFTISDELAVSVAGIESASILATQVRMGWIQDGFIDPTQTILYLQNQYEIASYIKNRQQGNPADDIGSYVFWLSVLYPKNSETVSSAESDLQSQANWAFLDPFTYLALFSFANYILSGEFLKMKMLPLGPVGYLPSIRVSLTPFGPEGYLDNYVSFADKVVYFYLRYGKRNPWVKYSGIGFQMPNLWSNTNVTLGMRGDIWTQPAYSTSPVIPYAIFASIVTDDDNPADLVDSPHLPPVDRPAATNIGALATLTVNYFFDQKKTSYGYAELGYKSSGYVQGQDLGTTPIARLGLCINY